MTTYQPEFGKRLLADRKARSLGRSKYAELFGSTNGKVANLEKGREPKPEEVKAFAHLAFVDSDTEWPVEVDPEMASNNGPGLTEMTVTREEVVGRYAVTYERLDGKPAPPFGYGAAWGIPGEGDPRFWSKIVEWCDQVDGWLNKLEVEALKAEVHVDVDGEEVEATTVEERPDDAEEGEAVGGFMLDAGNEAPLDVDEVEADEPAIVTEVEESFPDDGIKRTSNGELRTFKRCRRKWWFAYYRRLGLASWSRTGAAPLGTRIHRCLAVYYVPSGGRMEDSFEELQRTIFEDLEAVGGDEIARDELMKERDLAHAMLEGYFEWLEETAADQGIEVTAPETKVEVDAMMPDGGVHLIGKLDVRATREFGDDVSRLFIDHKTVGDLTSPTKMLQFDEQMLHYDLLEYLDLLQNGVSNEEAQAVRADGALYNMLRKVKRTAQAKPPFYGRVEVRHNIETLRSYWVRIKGEIADIIETEAKLDAGADHREVAYPNPTRDCSWDCDFYHVCTMADDGSRLEDMLAATYVEIDPLRRYSVKEVN